MPYSVMIFANRFFLYSAIYPDDKAVEIPLLVKNDNRFEKVAHPFHGDGLQIGKAFISEQHRINVGPDFNTG